MRIAYLTNQITHGGGAMSFYLIIKALKELGLEMHVYASEYRSLQMFQEISSWTASAKVIGLHQIKSSQTSITLKNDIPIILKKDEEVLKDFVQELLSLKIEILHVNNSVFPHVIKYVKEKTNIAIVQHVRELIFHSGKNEVSTFIADSIENYADKIITISPNEGQPFSAEKVSVLPNPFDFSVLEKLEYYDLRQKYNLEPATIVVGMFGRFMPSKGQINFLRIVKKVKNLLPADVHVKFVVLGMPKKSFTLKSVLKKILGKNEYLKKFNAYFKENELQQNVLLMPYTEEVLSIVNEFDLVVRPSDFEDPWGRDIIEAMALSKPIVAFGTCDLFIKPNKNGFLIHNKDFDEFTDKIIELVLDSKKRQQFGAYSKEIVLEYCSMDNYKEKLVKIYSSLLINRYDDK